MSQETREARIEAAIALTTGSLEADFLRALYQHAPPEDIVTLSPGCLAEDAAAMLALAQDRQPGQTRVRVRTPEDRKQASRVEVVTDNRPFLVDSIAAALNAHDLTVQLILHPVIGIERDPGGTIKAIGAGASESVMQFHIDRLGAEDARRQLQEHLAEVLAEVTAATEDWSAMRAELARIMLAWKATPPPADPRAVAEASAFLDWLEADHFVLLGYREYRLAQDPAGRITGLQAEAGHGLGVLRDDAVQIFDGLRKFETLPDRVGDFIARPDALFLTKTSKNSLVHRRAPMDAVGCRMFDGEGKLVAIRTFVGLYTSTAYAAAPADIPMLRRKADRVMKRAGFSPTGHAGKALRHILDNYPRDELLQSEEEALHDTVMGIFNLQERRRTALFVRRDPFDRFVSCLVYVARERIDTDLRLMFQESLEAGFEGRQEQYFIQISDSPLGRLHYVIRLKDRTLTPDIAAIEARLAEAARGWMDRLQARLIDSHGLEDGSDSARRYARAFPAGYRERDDADAAIADIDRIEAALAGKGLQVRLILPENAADDGVRLKLYQADQPIPLSDMMPILEDLGLYVIAERPHAIRPAHATHPVWLHDIDARCPAMPEHAIQAIKPVFEDAFRAIWDRRLESDGFNRLILLAGLDGFEAGVLRAYGRWLLQARLGVSRHALWNALTDHPRIARSLFGLFEARFDPAFEGDRAGAMAQRQVDLETALDGVASLEEDRILRAFMAAIAATMRTSFYQRDEAGAPPPTLALKIESGRLDFVPTPRPLVEIFVHSPRVEGVHLRGGRIARGGLRWSDRADDFRSEVLDLMKAQMVKNAVIVPVGAKGGFIVRRPPEGREAFRAEGVACYRLFISALLSLTDNLVEGAVQPPPLTVRQDGDDPYLVVAADKGTATFSDTANSLAEAAGFWLGDAFASGGSAGYDHKAMGITARGAFVGVERHFRERGHDIATEPFEVIGVGDMSGDVFGNGMLLSPQIRLVAAFNHLHIFVDPDPDPATSFAERQRLFEAVQGWEGYDTDKLSKGGRIFSRKDKRLAITPEIADRLAIRQGEIAPGALIRAILKAKADLLWFGGIGTYVKARSESHGEVYDKSNDGVRVDAEELQVTAIGEGANLGITHRGRIAFAQAGGRVNTDFIDNSGGVNSSDLEVNLKILFAELMAGGALTREARNQLLEEMTDEVAALVLKTNYQQTQAISMIEAMGSAQLPAQARLIRRLEATLEGFERAGEALPDEDIIAERIKQDHGLTRPEIATLLSYSKIALYAELLDSDVPDDAALIEQDLVRYFPPAIRETHRAPITGHRLAREIVATAVTNSLINRVGPSFVIETASRIGVSQTDVARAYAVARRVFQLRDLWRVIEALDGTLAADVQLELFREGRGLIARVIGWLLTELPQPLDIAGTIARFEAGVQALAGSCEACLTANDLSRIDGVAEGWQARGVPADLARRIARLPALMAGLDIVRLAEGLEAPPGDVASVYFSIGDALSLPWLRNQARAAGRQGSDWSRQATEALIEDFYAHQSAITAHAFTDGAEAWLATHPQATDRLKSLITELSALPRPELPLLTLINRTLRGLAG